MFVPYLLPKFVRIRIFCKFFIRYSLSFLWLICFTACSPLEIKHPQVFIIEDFHTGKLLWKSQIRAGDIIQYEFDHSVYRDRVYQTYEVTEDGKFLLIKSASTPRVLSLPYPGFELSLSLEESNKALVTIDMHKNQEQIIVVVGSEYTDNTITIGKKAIRFKNLVGDGAIVKMYIHRDW